MISHRGGNRLIPILILAGVALLAIGACDNVPAAVGGRVSSSPPPALPSLTAVANTATPTLTPAPTTPRPTATWVALITPSATPGEKVPTRADVPRIGVAEARALADAGEAVLIDVRGDAVYALSHIAGAISLPAGEVASRVEELDGRLAIFYCA